MRFIPAFNSVIQALYFLKIYKQSVKLISNEFNYIDNQNLIEKKNNFNIQEQETDNKSLLNIKNLYFRYEGREGFELKNINFELNKGKKVAITGSTGSGRALFLFNARPT